jgi:hypothetical protein
MTVPTDPSHPKYPALAHAGLVADPEAAAEYVAEQNREQRAHAERIKEAWRRMNPRSR